MRYKASTLRIIDTLKELYPEGLCSLQYEKDYELLFAVRLSAQCTDARVNMVTPALFARFPTLEAFAEADPQRGGRIHPLLRVLQREVQRSGSLRPTAAGAVRRQGAGQHGGSHLPARRRTENRQPDLRRRVRAALLCLRHPLHPHYRAAGHHRRLQRSGQGGTAAAESHPAARIRLFLPPNGSFSAGTSARPGRRNAKNVH